MRQGAFDYILKPVDDETIINVLKNIIVKIDEEAKVISHWEKANERVKKAYQLLKRDFFEALFEQEGMALDFIDEQIHLLEIPLRLESKLILLVGRIDHWLEEIPIKKKYLYQNMISDIVEKYLSNTCIIIPIIRDAFIIWLI